MILSPGRRRLRRVGAADWASILMLAVLTGVVAPTPSIAQSAAPITIAWDASAESGVLAYVVYVGTQPGLYTTTLNVTGTTLTYAPPAPGRYYFAVAAFGAGRGIGARSYEVSAVSRPAGPEPTSLLFAVTTPSATLSAPANGPHRTADRPRAASQDAPSAGAESAACTAETRADGLGPVTALAAAPDGALFVVERGNTIWHAAAERADVALALTTAGSSTRITGVAIDPSFPVTGHVFVGVSRARANGADEFEIVRYRASGHILGEGTAVVRGLRVSRNRDVPFTVDPAGRLYVAMPAEDVATGDPYAGHVLWFEKDGSLPAAARGGSPILAEGHPRPIGMARVADELWLVAADIALDDAVSVVGADLNGAAQWPLPRKTIRLAIPPNDEVVVGFGATTMHAGERDAAAAVVDRAGSVHALYPRTDNGLEVRRIATCQEATAVAVTVGADRRTYVVVGRADGSFAVKALSDVSRLPNQR